MSYEQLYDLVGNVFEITETYPDDGAMDPAVTNRYDKIDRLVGEGIWALWMGRIRTLT